MVDRTVKVSLVASVNGYIAGMDAASRKTREFSNDAQAKLAAQRAAFTGVGTAALAVGALAVAGVAVAIKAYSEFDQAMSQVKASTQETAENMGLLRAAALQAGGDTVFTATEAANAIEELGKNGLSTAQILGGALDASLDLAAAGGLEVARAAEIAAITMKQFKLEGADLPHVADLLAAGAGKAAGDVEDLAQALNQSALVAANSGLSIEETTGVLSAFADAGLLGSDAGTSLKTALQRLTPTSAEAQRAMEDLNISAYDQNGAFIGAANFAGVLRNALKDKTTEERNSALATIFGSDAVRAATVLYDQGAAGIRNYVDKVNDSGYASQVAADRLDNLAGDVEKLGGAFDTSLIQNGSGANDTLRSLVQTATLLIDGINGVPQPVLDVGLAFVFATGAVGLTGGAAFKAVPAFVAAREALAGVGISAKAAALSVGVATAALTLAVIAIAGVAQTMADTKGRTDSYRDSFDQATGAITDYTRELIAKNLVESGAAADAEKLGLSVADLTGYLVGQADAVERVNTVYGEAVTGDDFERLSAAQALGGRLKDVSSELANGTEEWKQIKSATEGATGATVDHSEALAVFSGNAGGAKGALDELAATIRGFADATLSSRDAERQLQEAIDAATQSVIDNGTSLDIGTEAGRKNQESLDAIATSAKEAAAAKFEQTGSEEQATAAIAGGRQALIDQLAQYGITGAAAETYADELGLIPSQISTIVDLNTDPATKKLIAIRESLDAFKASGQNLSAYIKTSDKGFAFGGPTGPGSKFQVKGVVHANEFVSTQETTAKPANRAALEYMHAGGDMASYGTAAFAQAAPAGAFGGGGDGAAPQWNVVLQSKGGVDLLKYVDVQIERADASNVLTARMGKQVR